MMRVSVAILALALASCSGAEPVSEIEAASFDVNSWGVTYGAWSVDAQGNGTAWFRKSDDDAEPANYRHEFHDFAVGPEGFAQLREELAALTLPAPDADACEDYMTDHAYGTLELTAGGQTQEMRWDSGCLDPDYAAYMERIQAADMLVTGWAEDAPVARTEQFGEAEPPAGYTADTSVSTAE